MYMNLKPNKHKRTSFNTTTMTSLWFIAAPAPHYFGLKFLGPPLLKFFFGGGVLLPCNIILINAIISTCLFYIIVVTVAILYI